MTLRAALVAVTLVLVGCSARQSTEQRVPPCLSLCANQFAACTEEFPGDAAACQPARNDCERTCRGERALQQAEEGQPEVLVPISSPDAGSNAAPDGGS